MGAYKHARYNLGEVAFGDVGASYGLLAASEGDYAGLVILNSLDNPVYISFDNSTNHFRLDAGEPLILNLYSLGRAGAKGSVYVKRVLAAPTTGSIRATFIQ